MIRGEKIKRFQHDCKSKYINNVTLIKRRQKCVLYSDLMASERGLFCAVCVSCSFFLSHEAFCGPFRLLQTHSTKQQDQQNVIDSA